jgi:hypothetical protein
MNKKFTNVLFSAIIVFSVATTLPARAQYTASTLESGKLASGMAKDASGNIYVVRFNFASGATGGAGTAELVKYTNGTGSPTVIYSGIPDEGDATNDFATGIVVATNGDIYLLTDNNDPHTAYGKIIKLTYNGGTSYTPSTWQTGTDIFGYYTALAIDGSNNLYVVQYNFNADGNANGIGSYEIDKYAAGSAANSAPAQVIYNKLDEAELASGALNAVSTGLAVAPNGDVYVTTGFNLDHTFADAGHIYKFTKASSYAISTISTGFQASGLSVDGSGNLYALQATTALAGIGYHSAYGLYEYPNGSPTQTPTAIYTPLNSYYGDLFPYGIVLVSPGVIYVTDGQANGGANSVLKLTNAALPVTWQSFDVKQDKDNYEWDWSLGEEQNVAGYTAQYSLDGLHFTDAGEITLFNNNHTYRFSKELPVSGRVFFRIREVDEDGHFSFSAIRSLQSTAAIRFSLYPNPATSDLTLQWPYASAASVQVMVVNTQGKIVLQQSGAMAYPLRINLSALPGGTYFIYGTDNNNNRSMALPFFKASR